MIHYSHDQRLATEEFIDILRRSTLAERRPVDDLECVESMLKHADILITAWDQERLVGVARSVTDFTYCCYLSDLAVDTAYQRQGIGQELIQQTRQLLGPRCRVILLSAPKATTYYPHIGFEPHPSAWIQ